MENYVKFKELEWTGHVERMGHAIKKGLSSTIGLVLDELPTL
mgnify:CR=1 FL=1